MTQITLKENLVIKFIDLFAGIGGFRLALEELGAKCVFSSEIDKFCQQTYEANFSEKPHGDITKIDANDIPDHDILCAGFPCQPFSIAGKRKGFDDERGNLFDEIIRIAKVKQPKVLFLENVKGLKTHDKGRTIQIIFEKLNKVGYWNYPNILNASDFGLPQNRQRVYIVAFRLDLNIHLRRDWSIAPFTWPQKIPLIKNVGSILEENVDPKYIISSKMWEFFKNHKEKHSKKGNGFGYKLYNEDSDKTGTLPSRYYKDGKDILIKKSKSGLIFTGYFENNKFDKNPEAKDHLSRTHRQGYRIYSPEGNACTLSSQGGGLAGKTGAYLINEDIRRLTPRECARLMGFPDSFKIIVSDNQSYKQFGNSVAIPVIKAIGQQILKVI